MECNTQTNIQDAIASLHENDEKQLGVIFSNKNRMMVEAPAGYGKTTTMISRIAYLFATEQIPNPKRMLGLTFSVNAALKVKRDVASKLPALLGKQNNPNFISEKTTITNYHGFCKGILKKYGYLLSTHLKNLDSLQSVGEDELLRLLDSKTLFQKEEQAVFDNVVEYIKTANALSVDIIKQYNCIVIDKLLPIGKITHNSIILFVVELFLTHPQILRFFQSYFNLIVIDEFQDTNIIAWNLIDLLITPNTNLLFMGDSLQRIYGFIGACPTIMKDAAIKYKMEVITLDKNYRFRNNQEMLKLDNNIRKNAIDFNNPNIQEDASLPCFWGDSQTNEALQIATKVHQLIENENCKVAVLVKNRGRNTEIIEEQLRLLKINYFYALFRDEDPEYIDFHNKCLEIFISLFSKKNNITYQMLLIFAEKVKQVYIANSTEISSSLVLLLFALVERMSTDYGDLSPDDRKQLLIDIFENRQLKQAMEYIDASVILCTVHGAKGLEWDYVLLADAEKYILTSFTTCNICARNNCLDLSNRCCCKLVPPICEELKKPLLEDLCVFYVAITRARRQVYISASPERFNSNGRQFNDSRVCCMSFLSGVKLVQAQ